MVTNTVECHLMLEPDVRPLPNVLTMPIVHWNTATMSVAEATKTRDLEGLWRSFQVPVDPNDLLVLFLFRCPALLRDLKGNGV